MARCEDRFFIAPKARCTLEEGHALPHRAPGCEWAPGSWMRERDRKAFLRRLDAMPLAAKEESDA